MLIALLLAVTLDEAPAAPAAPPASATAQATAPTPLTRPPSTTDAPRKDVRFVWRDHPSIRAGRWFRADFAAKFQLDGRDPGDNPLDFPTWEVHRMRVGVEGELFQHIQYQVERELTEREINDPLAKSTKTPWTDVYVEANYTDAAQLRVGKFKVPFGLDQISGESDLDFVYRSGGGRYLSPGRDVGAAVHGRFFDRGLGYWVGVFKQDGDNSRSSKIEGADTTVAARITARPLRRLGPGLEATEIGASVAVSELSDESLLPNGLRGRTVMSQYTFFEPVFVKGQRQRYGIDVDWAAGPFGSRAEFMYVGDSRDRQGLGDEDLSTVRGRAWYVLGTWVVTGEKKDRPVEARRGGVGRGGVGAIELKARYDRLWFDSEPGADPPFRNSRAVTILPNGDRVLTLGLTYYANRWVKIQLNAIRERVEDIERSPTLDGSAFWSPVFRLQIAL